MSEKSRKEVGKAKSKAEAQAQAQPKPNIITFSNLNLSPSLRSLKSHHRTTIAILAHEPTPIESGPHHPAGAIFRHHGPPEKLTVEQSEF
ncbi:hypothetical protein G4B88_029795 [Cannabis sativa]|uniref:Uncharacterized protein n=1 Tax=Cannabis sativa TaxID=3483 RepID=A0A7J6GGL0_CANSA|nr:hypothetical protein G4B88_029795 [Cannabis sativa]